MPRFNFTIEDSSPLISYAGGLWREGDSGESNSATSHDEGHKVTRVDNAKVTFDFVGTGVSIFGRGKPQDYGKYSIRLDNNTVNDDSRSSVEMPEPSQADLWHTYGLKNELHTVEARNELTASSSYFDIDFITIEREIGQIDDSILNSTIDDTDSSVQYHGEWERDLTLKTQNYNQTLHTTVTPDSSVEITFQGCCIELYGLYADASYSVSMDGGAPNNMLGMDVDLAGESWRPKTLLYLMDGLSEGYHKVSLSATNTTQSRPFSFDYAVVLSAKSSSNAGLSKGARIGLAVGLSLGGLILLGVLTASFCFLRGRRRRRHTPRMDIMSEEDRYEPPYAPAPTPWMSISPRAVMPPPSHTTLLFSSVVSGWHHLSDGDNRSDTVERLEESTRPESTQESVPPVSRLHVVTRDEEGGVERHFSFSERG